MMNPNKLYLLDGHALVYQYHFAFRDRPLINSKNVNTSAIHGFTRMLWDLLETNKPSHIAVVFDPKGPTFRSEIFTEYKANREAQPEDISIALPYIRQIVEGFNIPVIIVDNYEADDVIGTLAKQAEKAAFEVFMVTPDKDYGQLVTEHIHQYRPSRMGSGITILQKDDILKKWDIDDPIQVIDVLALMGDSSDNIPGVPGIGPKTAAKLLKTYGSLENILENKANIKGKNSERLTEFEEQAQLSYTLARIDINAPVKFDEDDFKVDPINKEVLGALFAELEIRSLAKKILGGDNQKSSDALASSQNTLGTALYTFVPCETFLVDNDQAKKSLLNTLQSSDKISFYLDISASQEELTGIAFSVNNDKAFYLRLEGDKKQKTELVDFVKPVFEDKGKVFLTHDFKRQFLLLKNIGITVRGAIDDLMIVHYLLRPELKNSLDYLSETYFGYAPKSTQITTEKKNKATLFPIEEPFDIEKVSAGEDSSICLQLFEKLHPKLEEIGVKELYQQVEMPLVRVLSNMEYNGVALDSVFCHNYSNELKKSQLTLEKEIFELAGKEFKISSPKQVGEVLFGDLGIKYKGSKTKTGQFKTSEATLQEAAKEHEIVQKILDYRGLAKLRSTYTDALPKLISKRDGFIHSNFNQAAVATGRLSSSNPNLQNIPMRTALGRQIRKAFVPRREGNKILSADYSQIELRLIAEFAKEKAMLDAFKAGHDIHKATAALVFDVPFEEVTDDQRRKAKMVNFAILYGAGSSRMSNELDISKAEATALIEQYYKTYADLKAYMESQKQLARDNGYVTTVLGRRRYLRDIDSRNGNLRAYAERNAVNTPIQGTAADIMKIAMINIEKRIKQEQLQALLVLQVHDELVFDVPQDEVDTLQQLVKHEMESAMPQLSVNLLVESGVGDNWLEAH